MELGGIIHLYRLFVTAITIIVLTWREFLVLKLYLCIHPHDTIRKNHKTRVDHSWITYGQGWVDLTKGGQGDFGNPPYLLEITSKTFNKT